MIKTNIIQRIFHVGFGNNFGTAFTMEHGGIQYLISAKHIFESITIGRDNEITIFRDKEWKQISIVPHIHTNDDIDIIVFELPDDISPRLPIGKGIGGLKMAQDTFFLGFPYGMFSPDITEINNKSPFPFIKKGIFSAVDFKDKGGPLVYLDGHTNPGFSGGPMVWVHLPTGELKIGGVIRGYIDHDEGEENSGIIKIHSIKSAIDIIEEINR